MARIPICKMGTGLLAWQKVTMTTHIKVLIVTNSLSGGGAEISMQRLFQSLIERDVEVELCAINQGADFSLKPEGVHTIGRSWGSGPIETLKNLFRFGNFLRRHKSDIVIVNCELPELYVSLISPMSSKIFVVEHTSRPWRGRRAMGIFIRTLLTIRRSRWITVSSNQQEIWPFGSSALYIPNPHEPVVKQSYTEKWDLVFVGRLNPGKRPEVAADAAQATQSTIAFFGDGPMLDKLREDYESEKCEFKGFVTNPWSTISSDSILVVTSEYEGDGMNIVEAVLNGNPVLLLDNIDLRRFDFPDTLYFKNMEELVLKIKAAKKESPEIYKPGREQVDWLSKERDLNRVTSQWITLIRQTEE